MVNFFITVFKVYASTHDILVNSRNIHTQNIVVICLLLASLVLPEVSSSDKNQSKFGYASCPVLLLRRKTRLKEARKGLLQLMFVSGQLNCFKWFKILIHHIR